MSASRAVQIVTQQPEPEYTIYTFGEPAERGRSGQWQKHESLIERDKALHLAQSLYDSGHFQRIEVKSRYFDRRMNRIMDLTLKTFGKDKGLKLGLSAVILFAAACSLAVFFLTGIVH